jgi:ribosomal protein L32
MAVKKSSKSKARKRLKNKALLAVKPLTVIPPDPCGRA